MQQILIFLFKNKHFFLFLLLFIVAFIITISTRTYHGAQFWNSANSISGNFFQIQNSFGDYFHLKKDNEVLLENNAALKKELLRSKSSGINPAQLQFSSVTGIVIKNSYNLSHNYLTINVGSNQGVKEDLGVISDQGVVGIIDRVNSRFARVQSILNVKSKISVQIKNTNHLGILEWKGLDPRLAIVSDVPSLAKIAVNDTIVTSGNSLAFPKGLVVGIIKKFELDESQNYYSIQIELINDLTSINSVYVITNRDAEDIKKLDPKDE
jgi:rod shape-determining protein MreC